LDGGGSVAVEAEKDLLLLATSEHCPVKTSKIEATSPFFVRAKLSDASEAQPLNILFSRKSYWLRESNLPQYVENLFESLDLGNDQITQVIIDVRTQGFTL
jgi:hypothetical protein